MAHLDIEQAVLELGDGYLTCRQHASGQLHIWNYTARCQHERHWTPLTMMCRGLITRLDGTIVARPFAKFFNHEEHLALGIPLPLEEPIEVTTKFDGSLGIAYLDPRDNLPCIATRGSFESEQALEGTRLLLRDPQEFTRAHLLLEQGITPLYEIVYPENRIVVDYGSTRALHFLGAVDNETGETMVHGDNAAYGMTLDSIRDEVEHSIGIQGGEDGEGYVIRFVQSDIRVKLKYAEYVKLHKLLTGMSERVIWEHLSGVDTEHELGKLLFDQTLPRDFKQWVRNTTNGLTTRFHEIVYHSSNTLADAQRLHSRKAQADYILTYAKYPHVVFAMLDNKKNWRAVIWKLLKPTGHKPFNTHEQAEERENAA